MPPPVVRPGAWARLTQAFGGISVGGGPSLNKLNTGTFVANTSAVAQFATETVQVALVGATTGDVALVWASTLLDAGLRMDTAAYCTATSTIDVKVYNHSSASVTQTSGLTNRYVFLRLTT